MREDSTGTRRLWYTAVLEVMSMDRSPSGRPSEGSVIEGRVGKKLAKK